MKGRGKDGIGWITLSHPLTYSYSKPLTKLHDSVNYIAYINIYSDNVTELFEALYKGEEALDTK